MTMSQMRFHNSSLIPTTTLLLSNRQPYPALDYTGHMMPAIKHVFVANVSMCLKPFFNAQSYLTDLHGALTRRALN